MSYALGFRVKSGQAIAVALSGNSSAPTPLMRALVALSDPEIEQTKQPYHAGFGTAQDDAAVVARLTSIVRGCARRSVDALLSDSRVAGRSCRAAALVVGSVIDPETVGNPHIRAHANEGRLFRSALQEALEAHDLRCDVFLEKGLADRAAAKLHRSGSEIRRVVDGFGRALGSPWRAEEKAAAAAAWVALL
jgi:hypothetical protein